MTMTDAVLLDMGVLMVFIWLVVFAIARDSGDCCKDKDKQKHKASDKTHHA